ncbi:MAG TPA: TolC family protein [Acidobacteriaceae bacterium]|nr:TolC family protein [Acidobacteriaceae bacterium]
MRHPDHSYSLPTIGFLVLAGCARYHPHPLPAAPDLARTPQITVALKEFAVPGLPSHPIPAGGLDETTVMTLAVLNNPDLKAARLQAGVAGAELLQAGLLPDPQIGVSFGKSALNYGGALSLSEDIQAILTRGAAKAAARASANQVNLNILWQEVQVAERARELFIQERTDSDLQQVLTSNQTLLRNNYDRDRAAMERGDVTAGTVAADLTLVADADTGVRQLQTEVDLAEHELNALLGIESDVQLHLVGMTQTKPFSETEFDQAISALRHRRADLLALQAGYQNQEETLRRAILAQFPGLNAGVDFERDPVEGVNYFGPQVTLTLPLFNRNRGQIAIARATRELLRQQYQAQLDSAVSQADQVWKATQIMAAQLQDLDRQLPVLQQAATAAEQSFRQNNLDAALYVNTRSALLTKQREAIRLRESLAIARSALSTLLGLPFSSP